MAGKKQAGAGPSVKAMSKLDLSKKPAKRSRRENFSRLNPHQSRRMGTGEAYYSYGVLEYMDDGNGNVFDASEGYDDVHDFDRD